MDPDEEPEPGSSSQSQNLHDLQNYLVTFNKDIGSGDDVLPNMDVDPGVGDVSDLYGTTSENSLQESGDAGVSGQFSSGFYAEQGILDATLSDEPAHQIQGLVSSAGAEGDAVLNELKQEVNTLDLEGVSSQMASFGDAHLAHTLPGMQAGSLSQGLIMTPLGDSIIANQGKVLRIVSLGGEDGQFLSLADGQQMQILNSEDLGLTSDGLDTGESSLDITSNGSVIRSGNADSPIPLASLSRNSAEMVPTSGIALTPIQSRGNIITTTASTGASLLNPGLEQLVALQGTGEGAQSQLVSFQGDAIHSDALQMPVLASGDGINADMAYQTITIMPSELSQHGEMNYVLILSQPDGDKESVASVAQVYDLKQESQDFPEELMDENGDTKQVLRFMPKKMVTHLGNQQLMCAFCNYTSPKRYLLTRHMRSHSDERPFKCESCDRGFKTSASLLNHVNTHTGTRPHKCKTCDAAFTTSGELVRHIRYRHTFEKPHRCPECDYASVELSKLKRHMRSHTGERPYKCPNCPYASPDTYKLKRHMRIHTGEKPYECDHCHARFTQSNSLKAHKLIHTGNKPVYQCSLCPTTCGRKTDLKIHFNKLHAAGLSQECRKCGKHFSDRYSYKLHLRTHDIDKCYKCDHCHFIAANEKSLEAHTLVHCGKYRCDECNTTFINQKQFDKHVAMLHPNGLASRNLGSAEKILNDGEEHLVLTDDKNSQGTLAPSLAKEGQDGDIDENSSSQVIITPLASDTLHKNLIQDIKEGKLGDVPQVVIVHPDGSQEEISSKLTNDRWNVGDDFPATSTSEVSATVENAVNRKATEMPLSLSGDPIATVGSGDSLFALGRKGNDAAGNLSGQSGDFFNQTESSQHCEAATQVEIESDADSTHREMDSDGDSNSDTASLGCGTQKGETEESSQQLTKALQDNVGPIFSVDPPTKYTKLVCDMTHILKPPTSTSPQYLKTIINKPSGKISMAPQTISQPQSLPSIAKVTQAVSLSKPVVSTSSSRTHQYSLLSSNVASVNSDGASTSKTSNSLSSDKNSESKVYVSLSSSEPPTQLLSGDVNLAMPLPTEGGQGDSIPMLELIEMSTSTDLCQDHMDDPYTDDNSNSLDLKEPKSCEKKTLSDTQLPEAVLNSQTVECNLSVSLCNQDSTSSNLLDQSAIQNLLSKKLALSSGNTSVNLCVAKEQNKPSDLELNLLSSTHESSSFENEATSLLEPRSSSPLDQNSSLHVDQTPSPPSHSDIGHDASSDSNRISEQDLGSFSGPCSESTDQTGPCSESSDQTMLGYKSSTDLILSETNQCDNLSDKISSLPVVSTCQDSRDISHPDKLTTVGNDGGSLLTAMSAVTGDSSSSFMTDMPLQLHHSSDKNTIIADNAEESKVVPDEQPPFKTKSTKGRTPKRKAETDPALVMTGKRQRKALVKVSM